MADLSQTIAIIFQGIDNATPSIAQVESALSRLQSTTDAALTGTNRFAQNIQAATEPLSALAVGAVKLEGAVLGAGAAFTAFSIQQAAQFQGAVLDLQKVLTDADGDINQYAEAANKLALEFGTAGVEVLQSVANFKQAGFTAQEALQLTRNALDLKIAGDVSAFQSSELLVASLKGFGLEAGRAATIVDLLNEVSNQYATNVRELGTGFAQLSPVAKAAGFSLQETAGILTPGIEVFRSGSEVANGLRTVLLRLVDDSTPVKTALESIGVAQRNANGDLRSARDVYFDVAAAFQKLEPSQRVFVAQQLAGIDQSAKFLAVMDGLNKTLAISGRDFQFAGSAAKEVEIRLASAEVQAKRVTESFLQLTRSIGAPLLDEFGGISDAITNIFASLNASVQTGALRGVVEYVESWVRDLQATAERVAQNLPAALAKADFSGFTRGLDAIRNAFGVLFGGIDLTTVDGLRRAIELAGAAFLGLSQFSAGVVESFRPLFDWLTRVGSGLEQLDPAIFKLAGSISGFAAQANLLVGSLVSLMPALEALLNIILLKQGIGLLGSLSSLAKTLPLAAGGVQTFGIAVTAYLASDKIIDLVRALIEWNRAQSDLDAANRRSEEVNRRASQALVEFADATGIAVKSVDEALGLVKQGVVVWDEAAGKYRKAGEALTTTGNAAKQATNPFEAANAALLKQAKAADDVARSTEKMAQTQTQLVPKIVPIINAATGAIVGYEQQMQRVPVAADKASAATGRNAEALKKQEEQARRAEEAQDRLRQRLEELASNERIKIIEAQVKINEQEVRAQTERIKATFDSLNNTVNSTADVINKAFGVLGDQTNRPWIDTELRNVLFEQIDRENANRERALKMQEDLTRAQVDVLRQQATQLARGDALIRVDGTGLAPHLEAFMWEILKAVQVRTNRDGLRLLLGVS